MTKICSRCKIDLPISSFSTKKRNSGKHTLQTFCKDCTKTYSKEHYKKNKQDYIDKNKTFKTQNQQKLLEYLKDKICKDCGIQDYRVFEFDHLRDKEKNIAKVLSSWSWDRILTEIEKCEIVCCNCHRLRTLKRSNSYRWGII